MISFLKNTSKQPVPKQMNPIRIDSGDPKSPCGPPRKQTTPHNKKKLPMIITMQLIIFRCMLKRVVN
ncbi:MAG: hypothetical protein COS35_09545 [Zetaproteobacteria bacterium CG02_land_8_20_14_3_00_50_9]|nr:MAG: hypothetical protein COW62_02240 [Zetaproteobacteria bacterium CG17_big_fil_post_rev_8_21_14_2_50_50_13]PIV29907.1 MAG: hypothetical protein COS35_09545 [Zetaproteobacteria bacterium CG02_land_8_20_14_3_00_50_9]PIY56154.1 MAG: hypothetical protein COZ00_05715 [Zetaproteobacteria bacterium CG_4_10_14_0_8_um_filter_49_80]